MKSMQDKTAKIITWVLIAVTVITIIVSWFI
nr:MAG TPA: hypothetical protein [Caudoviricetes sp.]